MNEALEEAVDLSIAVWKVIAERGITKDKLPHDLRSKIEDMLSQCPLCDLFKVPGIVGHVAMCKQCPLKRCDSISEYGKWAHYIGNNKDIEQANIHAQNIVDKLEKWKRENA